MKLLQIQDNGTGIRVSIGATPFAFKSLESWRSDHDLTLESRPPYTCETIYNLENLEPFRLIVVAHIRIQRRGIGIHFSHCTVVGCHQDKVRQLRPPVRHRLFQLQSDTNDALIFRACLMVLFLQQSLVSPLNQSRVREIMAPRLLYVAFIFGSKLLPNCCIGGRPLLQHAYQAFGIKKQQRRIPQDS